jgi:hypothetical protein
LIVEGDAHLGLKFSLFGLSQDFSVEVVESFLFQPLGSKKVLGSQVNPKPTAIMNVRGNHELSLVVVVDNNEASSAC